MSLKKVDKFDNLNEKELRGILKYLDMKIDIIMIFSEWTQKKDEITFNLIDINTEKYISRTIKINDCECTKNFKIVFSDHKIIIFKRDRSTDYEYYEDMKYVRDKEDKIMLTVAPVTMKCVEDKKHNVRLLKIDKFGNMEKKELLEILKFIDYKISLP